MDGAVPATVAARERRAMVPAQAMTCFMTNLDGGWTRRRHGRRTRHRSLAESAGQKNDDCAGIALTRLFPGRLSRDKRLDAVFDDRRHGRIQRERRRNAARRNRVCLGRGTDAEVEQRGGGLNTDAAIGPTP
ncbi:MAG: hypothetical protein ACK55I_14185, partial [bacterium]